MTEYIRPKLGSGHTSLAEEGAGEPTTDECFIIMRIEKGDVDVSENRHNYKMNEL